jgi:hypothetical protein
VYIYEKIKCQHYFPKVAHKLKYNWVCCCCWWWCWLMMMMMLIDDVDWWWWCCCCWLMMMMMLCHFWFVGKIRTLLFLLNNLKIRLIRCYKIITCGGNTIAWLGEYLLQFINEILCYTHVNNESLTLKMLIDSNNDLHTYVLIFVKLDR